MKMMKLIYPLDVRAGRHSRRHRLPEPQTRRRHADAAGTTTPQSANWARATLCRRAADESRRAAASTADIWQEFDNMIQDRAALAAYTIHFAFDSAVIRSSEQANLQSVASGLSSDPSTKLLIEGNCDERGTEEYNRSLGERRALAAREALAKLGVDPMRVRTISYGKDKPVDPGHDEAAWSQEPPRRFRAAASQDRRVISERGRRP